MAHENGCKTGRKSCRPCAGCKMGTTHNQRPKKNSCSDHYTFASRGISVRVNSIQPSSEWDAAKVFKEVAPDPVGPKVRYHAYSTSLHGAGTGSLRLHQVRTARLA